MTLAAWCDGLLSHTDRETIDVHIAACSRCADIVALVESDIAGVAATGTPGIDLEPVIDRAAKLVPGRHSWRFIATRFSGIAAALLFAVLGGWIGMRLAMRLNTTSDRSDSTMASLSYGIVDDLDREFDASGDPLELVATQLFDGSTS